MPNLRQKTKMKPKNKVRQKSKMIPHPLKTSQNNDGERIFASPLARKMAEEKGIDLSKVNGSGENGRVVKKDIESYTTS